MYGRCNEILVFYIPGFYSCELKLLTVYFRLKQMDNDRRKIDHDLHEMGKSFARSAEDEDMNEKLKVLNLGI